MDNNTETARPLAFLLSEGNGNYSRDVGTILSGEGALAAGTVLGIVTASGKYVASPNAQVAGKEGGETAKAILAYPVDATSADADAVIITRGAEVKAGELAYQATVNDATKKAAKATQLKAVDIIVR